MTSAAAAAAAACLLLLAPAAIVAVPSPYAQPAPMPSPFPRPQASDDSGPTTSTDKCDEGQYEQMLQDFDNCERNVNTKIRTFALTNPPDQLPRAVCQKITSLLKCFEGITATCYDAEGVDRIANNYLVKEFQKAENVTFLGRRFIETCPTLLAKEQEFVFEQVGSNKCTFAEYEDAFDAWKKCRDEGVVVRDQTQELAKALGIIELLVQADCKYYDLRLNTCNAEVAVCQSREKAAETRRLNQEGFKDLEDVISGLDDFPGFTFENSCPGILGNR